MATRTQQQQTDAMADLISSGSFNIRVNNIPFYNENGELMLATFSLNSQYRYCSLEFRMNGGDDGPPLTCDATVKLAVYVLRNMGYNPQAFAAEMLAIHADLPF